MNLECQNLLRNYNQIVNKFVGYEILKEFFYKNRKNFENR